MVYCTGNFYGCVVDGSCAMAALWVLLAIFNVNNAMYVQSKQSLMYGDITAARNQGLLAAYMNFAAIIMAFVLAMLAIGLVIGLYSQEFYCYSNNEGK